MVKQPTVSAGSFEVVYHGPFGEVRLGFDALAEFARLHEGSDRASVQRRTHLRRYFHAFCENADYRRFLSDEKFKKEDDFSDGQGGFVAISAFKAWQWRLYGAVMSINGTRCFVGVRVDASKKRDKADQALMRRAAKDIASLSEYAARGGD